MSISNGVVTLFKDLYQVPHRSLGDIHPLIDMTMMAVTTFHALRSELKDLVPDLPLLAVSHWREWRRWTVH